MAKKTNVEPGRIKCPACQSEVSADGKTMFKRSEHLIDLEGSEGDLEKIEQEVKKLEEKLKAANDEITKLKARPEPQAATVPKEGEKSGGKSRVGRIW